ncbi:Coenzyme A biosynthesis bifunctional protein CoaBC [bioreactor metagenome]|uniref:Coenzyme A biosynthesis bifunctional protein CoaBC n=1 Tax=bioreactor metagenome TaxID=1076179 RepID=A0A644WQ57_9ZZZZ|nr:bifunctional phosphopantothenoylcysteine decarboxylase/phosphopantothenate--cysteine ligase CoaBC [Methanocorpusculum sp.]
MKKLTDIHVVLGVCGSIAAVETIKLAHELRRRGAKVTGIISPAGCGIIHPDALTYACQNPALTQITGMVEHVKYCGEGGEADLLLIAPATANTISKIACGIDDTIITTFATTAIGRGMPVVVVPAMHESMYRHPAVRKNLETLKEYGIDVVPPRMEEEKAKIADIGEICLHVERAAAVQKLAGRRVLISGGSCREELDDVRILTTRSSGTMAKELALEAFRLGAEVTLVMNPIHGIVPCVKNVPVTTAADMHDAVLRESQGADYYLSAAAISDFSPKRVNGKIPSGQETSVTLEPLEKLITKISAKGIKIVGFKLGRDAEEEGRSLLEYDNIVLVLANRPETMGSAFGEYVFLQKDHKETVSGTKDEIAGKVWDVLV